MRELIWSILLGIVEGVTEFLPISSTGHLLLCQRWLGINLDDPFWKLFTVVIQFGAILSVLIYFRERVVNLVREAVRPTDRGRRPIYLILVGTIPVLVIGFLLKDWVDENMGSPWIVVGAIGIGGVLMILAEHVRPAASTERFDDMSWTQAAIIGLAQVLAAVFPGTSRSAATIIAGLFSGLSRHAAAEFSFFLAIPAMGAASAYKLLKGAKNTTGQEYVLLAVGCVVSFFVAWASIAFLMRIIRKHSFTPFAVYRVVLAIIVAIAITR
jgi:undecaprenyl-diphosphatase